MITEEFKSMLESIKLDSVQIEFVENYLKENKGRKNADCIEYADGSLYYSESYLKLMMQRERAHGVEEGQQMPIVHKAETIMIPCKKCGHIDKLYDGDGI